MCIRDRFSSDKTPGENTKISIDQILGAKTTLKKKPKTAEDKKRDAFCRYIIAKEAVDSRTFLLQEEFNVDMSTYNDPYESMIEDLLESIYTIKQINLIDFYLYERFDELGNLRAVEISPEQDPVVLEYPEQLYELLKVFK